jgi:hypothetical protein
MKALLKWTAAILFLAACGSSGGEAADTTSNASTGPDQSVDQHRPRANGHLSPWRPLAAMPSKRANHCSVIVGDMLVVIGGITRLTESDPAALSFGQPMTLVLETVDHDDADNDPAGGNGHGEHNRPYMFDFPDEDGRQHANRGKWRDDETSELGTTMSRHCLDWCNSGPVPGSSFVRLRFGSSLET